MFRQRSIFVCHLSSPVKQNGYGRYATVCAMFSNIACCVSCLWLPCSPFTNESNFFGLSPLPHPQWYELEYILNNHKRITAWSFETLVNALLICYLVIFINTVTTVFCVLLHQIREQTTNCCDSKDDWPYVAHHAALREDAEDRAKIQESGDLCLGLW